MKKYQSSYVLKQIKKKRIFEKKIHMDFPYGFSIQLDTRDSQLAENICIVVFLRTELTMVHIETVPIDR